MKINLIYDKDTDKVIITECGGKFVIPENMDLMIVDVEDLENTIIEDKKGNVYIKRDGVN